MNDLSASPFQANAGKPARGVCARINRDTIVVHLDVIDNRMSVDHDRAMLPAGLCKLFPDEKQILLALPCDRSSRTDASVHEKVVAALDRERCFFEKPNQMPRDRFGQPFGEVETVLSAHRRRYAVFRNKLEPAIRQPDVLCDGMTRNALQQQILMISLKEYNLRILDELIGKFKTLRACWTPIDEVAQKDNLDLGEGRWAAFPVRNNLLHKVHEKIIATVNVPNGVDTLTRRRARFQLLLAKEGGHYSPLQRNDRMPGNQSNRDTGQPVIDISFVIACYNAGPLLEPAVRSALDQEGITVEVIVVDDGSSDGSFENATRLSRSDPRVAVLQTASNSGPGGARNVGMNAMRGNWFAVLDSDDLLSPDRGRKLIAIADQYGADMIADNLMEFGEEIEPRPMFAIAPPGGTKRLELPEYFQRSRLFGREPSPGYLKPMIRRSALDQASLRYNPALRIGEDDELIIRALNANLKYVVCDYSGYCYRRHSGSISHRLSLANLDRMIEAEHNIAGQLHPAVAKSKHYRGRWNALVRGRAFTSSVEALKTGSYVRAALEIAKTPSAIPLYSLPVAARLQRLRGRLKRLS